MYMILFSDAKLSFTRFKMLLSWRKRCIDKYSIQLFKQNNKSYKSELCLCHLIIYIPVSTCLLFCKKRLTVRV